MTPLMIFEYLGATPVSTRAGESHTCAGFFVDGGREMDSQEYLIKEVIVMPDRIDVLLVRGDRISMLRSEPFTPEEMEAIGRGVPLTINSARWLFRPDRLCTLQFTEATEVKLGSVPEATQQSRMNAMRVVWRAARKAVHFMPFMQG
jgi:hypothetical protein